jgi:hypothetical protein
VKTCQPLRVPFSKSPFTTDAALAVTAVQAKATTAKIETFKIVRIIKCSYEVQEFLVKMSFDRFVCTLNTPLAERSHDRFRAMDSPRASELLKEWRASPGEKTLGGLVDAIGPKSFALLFIILLGLPALPLPTGGITHVLEVVAMLLALQLILGRKTVWIPARWRGVEFEDGAKGKFIDGLINTTTRLERYSKPRMARLFGHRLSDVAYGVAVLLGTIAAFLAPPFTGLDTLPAFGVVILSVGVIMEDIAFVIGGAALVAAGVLLEATLGDAAYRAVRSLF